MKPIVFPHMLGSHGARLLAHALGTKCVRSNGAYRPKAAHITINWGNSVSPTSWRLGAVLNNPNAVRVAVDKLAAFDAMKAAGVSVPQFTRSRDEASTWFRNRTSKVVCRTMLRASEGRGIIVAMHAQELVPAPLYVKFFSKTEEFRVHVFRGQIIDIQQKRLRNGYRNIANRSQYIRNTDNGWVFTREGVNAPEVVRVQAVAAVTALGLDFGAADIAVNKDGECVVFEVNTAPGLEGTTVTNYANVINNYVRGLRVIPQ